MISPQPKESVNWTQNDYDIFFMHKSTKVSTETDDPKYELDKNTAVGAVITKENRIVSASANRLPARLRNRAVFSGPIDPNRYVYIEHAERAAIFEALKSQSDITSGTMYCTRFPCVDCARAIIFSGLARLVVKRGFSGEGQWIESQRNALRMLRKAGVTIRYLSLASVDTQPETSDQCAEN